jgi:hypothetical protein
MIITSILITSILLSYSIRTPIIDTLPLDYELRAGIDWQIDKSKYNIKSSMRGLYEREIGIHGWGHDFYLSYEKPDKILKKLFNFDLKYKRQFTSYDRQVKNMNLQTVDTGYVVGQNEWLRMGYSITFEELSETNMMYYLQIGTEWLNAELRLNHNKSINTIRLQPIIPFKNNFFLKPLFRYLDIDGKKDYWGKLEIGYKFKKGGTKWK